MLKDLVFDLTTIDWSAISSISSVFALIAVIFTIAFSRKQLSHSYKPNILFQDLEFEMYKQDEEPFFSWKKDNKSIPQTLIFHNIGIGPAINVQIKWAITKDELIEELKGTDFFDDDSFIYQLEIEEEPIYQNVSVEYIELENKSISYLNDKSVEIRIPSLLSIYIDVCGRILEKDNKKTKLIPFIISYYDLGNKIRKQKLFMNIEIKRNYIKFKDKFDAECKIKAIYLNPIQRLSIRKKIRSEKKAIRDNNKIVI